MININREKAVRKTACILPMRFLKLCCQQMELSAFPDWLTECQPVSRCQISSGDKGMPSVVLWDAVSDMIYVRSTKYSWPVLFLDVEKLCSSIKRQGIIIYCNSLFLFILETSPDSRNVVVTELQLSDISFDVRTCWREVGRKLLIGASNIHNLDNEYKSNRDKAIALLLLWKQQEGSNATVGRLADVLESVGRRSIAERLLGG